jgi:hypothetical protein
LGLVSEFLLEVAPDHLCRQNISVHSSGSKGPLCDTLATGLLHVLTHLHHNRTSAALLAAARLSEQLGWDWRGTHLTGMGHGQEACWDQIALLRVLMDASADTGAHSACTQRRETLLRLRKDSHWACHLQCY